MSGRTGSGSFGSGRTAGYAIGEDRTSPWLEAIAGIREQPRIRYPRLAAGGLQETDQKEKPPCSQVARKSVENQRNVGMV